MCLTDFDFPFDPSLIADHPVSPRDHARLLHVPRGHGAIGHYRICDLPHLLKAGDVLVFNDTKVIPARLRGRKRPGGGKVELLMVKPLADAVWHVLLRGRVKPGQVIEITPDAQATVLDRQPDHAVVRVEGPSSVPELLQKHGEIPLPPYIKRPPTLADQRDYQTIFAREEGAIAAPTAGLHFTPRLLEALSAAGIRYTCLTLHVGPGTFRPVTTRTIEHHVMEPEWYAIPKDTAEMVNRAKQEGRRIVAVGTTVVRALEAAADESGEVHPGNRETSLLITPGYRFQVVEALMTNFHLPRTTLLMLVSAFMGIDQARRAYEEALAHRYRFYSYGDAMLIDSRE
ncbi:MAG: tRNA preQ1(34) S-adenosylmethionine ribosyltransferase-isomerase QueA [Nitrospirae bacterium]|nr:MAG: tRNA preQ1(34) S-adenosylmethionine ribosyltransferase-isomerase QueA [Nitrospirota bacterium]